MNPQPRENIASISPYIPGKPIEDVRRELGLKSKIIKLASNENPLGPSKLAVKAIRKALKGINLYPDDGCYALGKRMVDRLGITEEQLIFGNGSVDIIEYVYKTFVAPKDHVVMAEQSFIMGKIAAKMTDAYLVEIPLKNYTHDLEAMAKAVTPKTKLIYIANPNNPTGTMVNHDQLKAFVKSVPESCVIVLDEAYSEYITRSDFPRSMDLLKEHLNLLILHTFSKIYGLAGLRVGYGIGSPELISSIRKVRLPFNIGLLSQNGCLAALDDVKHLERSRQVNDAGREFLYREFDKMEMFYVPSEGNFMLIDPKLDSIDIFARLQKRSVIVRPVKNYGLPTALRITIGTEKQNKKLVSNLKKVIKEIRKAQ